ncbi:protein GRIM REAPER, partial [Carica papaya]|uniref:protein GRIM REAPER n=1 Tax=Carica papaya TaxID=3649 RepID=UPI000B8CC742
YSSSLTLFALIILSSLVVTLHLQGAAATFSNSIEEDDDQVVYVIDAPIVGSLPSRSRFLASKTVIKKGTRCNRISNNICNGISANNGTSILNCCKKHCRNVLGDMNNCGRCGKKCKFGERCCRGACTNVVSNANHCGKCSKKCESGVRCEFGTCGYA